MDFQTLKRRDLQTLCKFNNIPANTTNASMADALASLPIVEGLEEILGKPETDAQGSPERSVIISPAVPRTTSRRKALKEELECSKFATRTRCGTSRTRALEGTNTRKTTATRTTQKRACQVAAVKKVMEKDLQAEFEADLEQSDFSESSVLGPELEEFSEQFSGVSVVNEGRSLSENQNEAQNELQPLNDGEEVIDVDDVNEAQKEPSETMKVDFHSLIRKDLQNLCKKNKIPANMTNTSMADALASLEVVEGLQEFLKDYDSQNLSSPPVLGLSKSCARQSRTTLKITKDPPSSKLITKSCRGLRRRVLEETQLPKNDVPETPAGFALCETEIIQEKENSVVPNSELKKLEISSIDDRECHVVFSNCSADGLESSEVSRVSEFNSKLNNSLMQEPTVNESTLEDAYKKGDDNVLSVELEELVSKMDENIVEESSEDAEAFVIVKPPLVASCDLQLEKKVCSEESELESTQVRKSETFEMDADNESDDPQLQNLASAHLLAAEDQVSKDFVSKLTTQIDQLFNLKDVDEEFENSQLKNMENTPDATKDQISLEFVYDSTTEVDQLLNSEFNEHNNSGNKNLEGFSSTAQTIPVELEHSSHVEDELPEKSFPTSIAQADEIILEFGEKESDYSYAEDFSENSDSESGSEDNYTSLSETSYIEAATKADNKLLELKGVGKSEDSGTEDDMSENSNKSDFESESDTEQDMSEKSDIETAIKADKHLDVESEFTDRDAEDDMSENSYKSDSESEFDTEQDMSEKSDIEATIKADKLWDVESDSEDSCSEVENFDSEPISRGAQEISVDIESERNQHEKLSSIIEHIKADKILDVESESGRIQHEKLDTASGFATGPTKDDSCVPTKNVESLETPLQGKSMRQLKRILKAKLQAAELQALANSMGNLNLEDSEKPLLKIEEDLQESEEDSKNGIQDSLIDGTLSNDQINDSSENKVITSDVNATVLCTVDNEVIAEDVITGDTNIDIHPLQQTPSRLPNKTQKQPFLFTPPSKKPMSSGRRYHVLDVNKENIDNSGASRTEPTKFKVDVTESEKLLSMSIGKLKKEVKVLQQQSEKKRQALQSRSKNLLTSP